MMRQLIAIFLLLTASLAQGDVRVVEDSGSLRLEVQPTARGVWTVARAGGRGVSLNVDGDLYGDSYPVHAKSTRGVIVAWSRPSGSIQVALADASGEVWRRSLDAPGVVGSPVVVDLEDSALIAWASGAPDGAIKVALHLGNGQFSDPVVVDHGDLAGFVRHGDGALIIVRDLAALELRVWSVVAPEPLPILWLRPVAIEPLNDASAQLPRQLSTAVPCISSSVDRAAIAWRIGPGMLRLLVVDDGLAHEAAVIRGGNACHAADARLR